MCQSGRKNIENRLVRCDRIFCLQGRENELGFHKRKLRLTNQTNQQHRKMSDLINTGHLNSQNICQEPLVKVLKNSLKAECRK